MRLYTFAGLLALSFSALTGCASTQQPSLSGTVSNGGREILNDGTLQVTLVDNASGAIVASKSIPVGGRRMPIAFTITPEAPLAPTGRYELRARIYGTSGELLYQSTQGVPVTPSAAGSVDVVVTASGNGRTVSFAR